MALSENLKDQFAKLVNTDKTKSVSDNLVYGTVKAYSDGTKAVILDGSSIATPFETVTDAEDGDRVIVTIKNHKAVVTGNLSSPAARTDAVKETIEKIGEFNTVLATKVDTDEMNAVKATIKTVEADNATIKQKISASEGEFNELKTKQLEVEEKITAAEGDIKSLKTDKIDASVVESEYIKTKDFDSYKATIGQLSVDIEDVRELMFGSATGTSITTEFANAVISVLGNAQITDAMISDLSAGKIKSLDINTTKLEIHSEDGKSKWKDNTIQICDDNRVRIQIGKDSNSDYNLYVWDKAGKLMFDAIGITGNAIQRPIIRNDMVTDDANISAGKLDIASLFDVINNDGTHTLNSSKIYFENEKQTLNVILESIQSGSGRDYTSWGNMLKISNDFIDQKLWWSDLDSDGNSINSKFNDVTQNLNAYEIRLNNLSKQIGGDFRIYDVTEEPTLDNYPAFAWWDYYYPDNSLYPDDSLYPDTMLDNEFDKHVGDLAYCAQKKKTWRWIQGNDGEYRWVELNSTEFTYLLDKNASLKMDIDSITTEISNIKVDIKDNYLTTTEVQNSIAQAVTDESNSIKLEISKKYATNETLSSYATKAELELKIDADSLISELNASADVIRLKAGRLIIDSGNFILDKNGNVAIRQGLFATGQRTKINEDVDGLYIGPDGFDYCWHMANNFTEFEDRYHLRMDNTSGFNILVNNQKVFRAYGDVRVSGGNVGTHVWVNNLIYKGVSYKYEGNY